MPSEATQARPSDAFSCFYLSLRPGETYTIKPVGNDGRLVRIEAPHCDCLMPMREGIRVKTQPEPDGDTAIVFTAI